MENNIQAEKKEPHKGIIIAISVVIPLIIALLFNVKIDGYDFSFLPPVYATINGMTAVLLVWAVIAIKGGKRILHERLINICVWLSITFLIMYILYHVTSDSTPYGGTGPVRYVYFFVLISHIILSIGIIPLVLFTYVRAWYGNFDGHKALAKFAFPFWLYVAVTGVIVYLMISPYYNH